MKHERERRTAALVHDEDLLDDLPIAVLILVDGELVRTNDGWTSLTGLDWRQSIGDQWLRGIHADDRATALQMIEPNSGERIRIGELRVHSVNPIDGETWVHARTRFVAGSERTACVITLTETNARKAHELRLLHLATHDTTTGLPNREHFLAELEREIARVDDETNLAVLFIDLDRFKEINDRHGHSFGDIVLAAIAQRLQTTLRASEIVARLGGDEFAILMPGLERLADAAQLANRTIATLSAPLMFGDRSVSVGASIGIAISAPDQSARELVDLADQAMYRSKSSGGSQWTFAEPTPLSMYPKEGITSDPRPVIPDAGSTIEDLVHKCQGALAATEAKVLTVVGRLEGSVGEEANGVAEAAEVLRRRCEELWTVVADATVSRPQRQLIPNKTSGRRPSATFPRRLDSTQTLRSAHFQPSTVRLKRRTA